MNPIIKRLQKFAEGELCSISEAIDVELERRLEGSENVADSARRRALQREKSYRRNTGSTATPVRLVGMRKIRKHRRAA
ncbi:MAG TPA: hypothetical protein VMY42_03650 [Thermoguttaceae bacterium]|nr:hypothetical protein [Thermoguttaceae bacterium]